MFFLVNREFWDAFYLSLCSPCSLTSGTASLSWTLKLFALSMWKFGMASISLIVFFVLSHLLLLYLAEEENRNHPNCSPLQCGNVGIIRFPFRFSNSSDHTCGLVKVHCEETPPMIQLRWGGRQYELINISYTNTTQSTRIKDLLLSNNLNTQC